MKQTKVRAFSKKVRKSSRQNSRLRGMRAVSIERRPSRRFVKTPMGVSMVDGVPYGLRGPDTSKDYRNDDA